MKKLCFFGKNPNLNSNASGHYFYEGLEAQALSYKKYVKKSWKLTLFLAQLALSDLHTFLNKYAH